MSQFFLQRLATLIATLAVASLVVFGVLEVLPGNTAQTLLGPDADPEAVAALAAQLGLDQPAWQRYLQWVHGLLTGALGDSHAYGSPVAELILERLQLTIPLAVLAMLLAAALALGAGLYAAAHHRRPGDWGLMGLAQIGIALPNFWFAILLILLFAVQLQWFPAGGFPGWRAEDGGGLWPGLHALVLPALRHEGGRWIARLELLQADAATPAHTDGRRITARGRLTGSDSASTQQMTCQPPSRRERRPPSA